jgi:hypothetical protein
MVAELSRRGDYSILGYTQPSVPQQPTNSQGVSFNGVQKIDAKWGLFLRANGASGTAVPIETSIAWGGIYNNPLERNKLDQVGLGLFWDKTNLKAVAQPARSAEMGSRTLLQLHPLQSLAVDPRLSALFRPCPETGRRPCRGLHDPNHGFLLTYCDRCEAANTSP